MRRLSRLALALVLAAGSLAVVGGPAQAVVYTPPAARQRIDLNAGWKFLRADATGAQAPAFSDGAPSTGTRSTGIRRRPSTSPAAAGRSARRPPPG